MPGGAIRISPLVKIGVILFDREWKLLREFGGSPSSRTRVQVVDAETDADALQKAMARSSKSESECDSIQ